MNRGQISRFDDSWQHLVACTFAQRRMPATCVCLSLSNIDQHERVQTLCETIKVQPLDDGWSAPTLLMETLSTVLFMLMLLHKGTQYTVYKSSVINQCMLNSIKYLLPVDVSQYIYITAIYDT